MPTTSALTNETSTISNSFHAVIDQPTNNPASPCLPPTPCLNSKTTDDPYFYTPHQLASSLLPIYPSASVFSPTQLERSLLDNDVSGMIFLQAINGLSGLEMLGVNDMSARYWLWDQVRRLRRMSVGYATWRTRQGVDVASSGVKRKWEVEVEEELSGKRRWVVIKRGKDCYSAAERGNKMHLTLEEPGFLEEDPRPAVLTSGIGGRQLTAGAVELDDRELHRSREVKGLDLRMASKFIPDTISDTKQDHRREKIIHPTTTPWGVNYMDGHLTAQGLDAFVKWSKSRLVLILWRYQKPEELVEFTEKLRVMRARLVRSVERLEAYRIREGLPR